MKDLSEEKRLLVAEDEMRRREIERENAAAAAGLAVLSKHPAWNSIPADLSGMHIGELEKPIPLGIDEIRSRAFELFDAKAELLLRAVFDTETANACCQILPVLSRIAFSDCRLGQPPQYCRPISGDALSFERKVALHMERAKNKAYEKASQGTNHEYRSGVTSDHRQQSSMLDPVPLLGGPGSSGLRTDALQQQNRSMQQADTESTQQAGSEPNFLQAAGAPRKTRGRPVKISDELKERALRVKGGKERAKILYQTQHPTAQQVKNVPTILKHFNRKVSRKPE